MVTSYLNLCINIYMLEYDKAIFLRAAHKEDTGKRLLIFLIFGFD